MRYALALSFLMTLQFQVEASTPNLLRWVIPGGKVVLEKDLKFSRDIGIQGGVLFPNVKDMDYGEPQCILRAPQKHPTVELLKGTEFIVERHDAQGPYFYHTLTLQSELNTTIIFQCVLMPMGREMAQEEVSLITTGLFTWQFFTQEPHEGSIGKELLEYRTGMLWTVEKDFSMGKRKYFQDGIEFSSISSVNPARFFCFIWAYEIITLNPGAHLKIENVTVFYSTDGLWPSYKPHLDFVFSVTMEKSTMPANISCYSEDLSVPTNKDFMKTFGGRLVLP